MSNPLRVLFVDDSEDDAQMLHRELERGGYGLMSERVDTASAMAASLEREKWDLLIIDGAMPRFHIADALDLVQKRGLEMPVLVLTGDIRGEGPMAILRADAHDCLRKDPLARLVPAVQRELEEAAQQSQRHRTEQALQESEELFRSLSASSPIGIFLTDLQGDCIYANPRWRDIYGLGLMQSVGDGWLKGVHPEDRDLVERKWHQHVAEGRECDEEFRVVTPQGLVRWVCCRSAVRRSDQGDPVGFVGTVEDITDKKKAEENLYVRNYALASSLSATVMTDLEGRVTYANEAALKMWGQPDLSDMQGRMYHEFTADPKKVAALFLTVKEQGHWAGEVQGRHRNGSPFDIHASVSLVRNPAGVPLGLMGWFIDMTEQKRAQERLRLQAVALEAAANAIVITDVRGKILWVNPAFGELTGYSPSEAVGQDTRLLKSGQHDEAFYRTLWETILSGQAWRGEMINRRKDGSLYTEQMVITPLRGAGGEITHFIAIKQDVTNVKQLEEQLRQAQKLESVGMLAGGVAHDFNNILTAILGYSQLLLQHGDLTSQSRTWTEEVVRSGERAVSLTRQLLAFSRRQILAPKVFDMAAMVADISKMLRRLIGEDVTLHFVAPAQLCCVKADPGQIEQVILNLCVNARDAMPDGGQMTIEVQTATFRGPVLPPHPELPAGEYILLAVTDTGFGMTPEVQARIFEPFFTTKGPGKGTGLGLSTCYGIVKQSGGRIGVSSELGKGTTFKIWLPRVYERAAPAQAPLMAVTMPRGGGETILVVEDEDPVRELTSLVLEELGYRVLVAADGQQALDLVVQRAGQPIDLLMTDVILPGLNGQAVAQRVQSVFPQVKVVYCSGYTDDAIVHHGVLDPGVAFLQKPFTPFSLALKVREMLDAAKPA